MKVAINITREQLGGITISNLNLIKHLYKDNIQISGIELNGYRYMKGPVLYRSFDPILFKHNIINIHDYNIGLLIKKAKSLKDVELKYKDIIKILCNILKEEKPDVIVISGTYYMPWLLSIAAKKMKIPIILWYSGVLTKETDGYPNHYRKIFRDMERSIIKRSEEIIFPSEICKAAVEKLVTNKKILNSHIIPNPVSYDFINETAVNFSVNRSLASVGRYTGIKNIDKFFKIHELLKKDKWEHECVLVTNTHREKIKKIPKTVDVLPAMDVLGLKKFYLSQGLIICPSWFETFGNVPMEAVCMGIPVLVNTTMGCSEVLIKAGLSNMVISYEDEDSKILDRVVGLCGQSILPQQINAVRKILDPDLVHEKIKSIIISVLED